MLLEQAVEVILIGAEADLVIVLGSELSSVGIGAVGLVLVTGFEIIEEALEGSALLSGEHVEDQEQDEASEVSSEHSLSNSRLLLLGGSHGSFALSQDEGRDDNGQETHVPDVIVELDLSSVQAWGCRVGHDEVGEVLVAPWDLVLLVNESSLASSIGHFISATEDTDDAEDEEDPGASIDSFGFVFSMFLLLGNLLIQSQWSVDLFWVV